MLTCNIISNVRRLNYITNFNKSFCSRKGKTTFKPVVNYACFIFKVEYERIEQMHLYTEVLCNVDNL